MDAFQDFLQRQLPQKLGTVLHLGAGARALELHAGFTAQRLVLVEGDPDTFTELEVATRESGRVVQVHGDVVMPAAGTVQWRRFSVRAHNGPVARDALLAYYPRLRQWTATPRPGRDIAELVARLDIRRSETGPNVLLLDTPGQTDALLRRLSVEALQAFDWLVLTEYRQELDPTRSAAESPATALAAASFAASGASGDDTSGPWSFEAWHFDHRQYEHTRLLHELEVASRRATSAEQMCESLRQGASAEAERWQHQLDETQAGLQTALAERDETRSRAAAVESGLRAELAAVQTALEEQRRAQDTHQSRIAELTAERDREAHWHKENKAWARALDTKTKQLQGQLEAAQQELQQAQEQVASLREAEASARAAETKARDEQARAHQEQARKTQALEQELDSLRQQLSRAQEDRASAQRRMTERDSRQALLDQEVLRAEAQLDLIKDVLLREKNF